MGNTTYRDALRKALSDGMTADPDIVLIGEEVGRYGGAYGVTKGLIDEFGAERVIDTPISEPSIVGLLWAQRCQVCAGGGTDVCRFHWHDDGPAGQSGGKDPVYVCDDCVPMILRTQGGTGRSGRCAA